MEKIIVYLVAFLVFVSIVVSVSALCAVPFYFLWNWLMPLLFTAPKLSFLQAWGLFFFLSIIGNLFRGAVTSSSKA